MRQPKGAQVRQVDASRSEAALVRSVSVALAAEWLWAERVLALPERAHVKV